MQKSVGMISLGAYIPGAALLKEQTIALTTYLRQHTLLTAEYIAMIEQEGALPGQVETNYEGWEKHPWFGAWLLQLPEKKRHNPFQGTKERRIVPLDPDSLRNSIHPHPMRASDAETLAGAMALSSSECRPEEIDLVLAHSQFQDLPIPNNASLIQHKLKLTHAGAYGIDSCCSSFITMLEIAYALIRAGIKKKILVVNSAIHSFVRDKSDYYSVMIGDAAAAAVVAEVEDGYGYIGSASRSHGDMHDGIIVQYRKPHLLKEAAHWPRYEQEFATFYNPETCRRIGATSEKNVCEVIDAALNQAGLTMHDISFLITHQPVAWAADAWRKALRLSDDRCYESYQKYGNMGTCSVPVNLFEAIHKKRIQRDARVLLASPGAGENHIALIEKPSPRLLEYVQSIGIEQ